MRAYGNEPVLGYCPERDAVWPTFNCLGRSYGYDACAKRCKLGERICDVTHTSVIDWSRGKWDQMCWLGGTARTVE